MPDRTSADFTRRPGADEYDVYYRGYIEKVPEGDVLAVLRAQLGAMESLVARIPGDRADYRYAPGKWTTREVLGHLVDMEWIFTVRALHFARGDRNALPGVEQDDFMRGANFDRRTPADLIDEWRHLRSANLRMFASFDDDILARRGIASERPVTVRALIFMIAGHLAHHLGVIRERYLGA